MHPALADRVRRAVRPTRNPQTDLVSVVVPFYNVEAYFAACLNSIIRQSYRRLEIIVVDDGSPDGSLAIARAYARWDPRIKIVRQANAGLGAARNTGLAAARGRYLTFVDSDDLLTRDAISLLVRTLQNSGSDFAVGAIRRFDDSRQREIPGWVRQVHREQRLGIGLDDLPDVLMNVFAWNKLFDREFFLRAVGGFPVGVRYEDQEATAKAYLRGRFDVLTQPVYLWRKRGDGTSITQQKTDPKDLADRLEVKAAVAHLMAAEASRAVYESWTAKAIGFDLRPYYEQVPRTGSEFWHQLRTGLLRFSDQVTDDVWRLVSLVDRYPALCVRDGHPHDLATFLTRRDTYGWSYPVIVGAETVDLDPDYLAEVSYHPPADLLRLAPIDLRLVAKLWNWDWTEQGLVLTGYALITSLPSDIGQTAITLTAHGSSADGTTLRVPLMVEQYVDERVDRESNESWATHRGSAFRARLDPAELTALDPGGRHWWRIEVEVRGGPVVRTGRLNRIERRSRATTPLVTPDDGTGRWFVDQHRAEGVRLRRRPRGAELVATAVGLDHGDVTVVLPPQAASGVRVVAERPRRQVASTPTEPDTHRIGLPPARAGRTSWALETDTGRAVADPRSALDGRWGDLVRLEQTRAGLVRVRQARWSAVAEDVLIDGGQLRVMLRSLPVQVELSAVLTSERGELPADLSRSGETVTVNVDLDAAGPVDVRSPYDLVVTATLDGTTSTRGVRVARSLLDRLPVEAGGARLAFTAGLNRDLGLRIQLRAPYAPAERGRRAQRLLQTSTREHSGVQDAVLFESFNGRTVGDSPLALCRELLRRGTDLELFWTVDNLSRAVPEGTTALLLYSQRWMEVMNRARFLVNANNFPHYFRKHPDQRYLQTWHGTPLKKIGNHVPGASLSLPYRALMEREPTYWDLLLAQNPFAAQVLPDAFGYTGDVLATGYPRNDSLVGVGAEQRAELRARLGLRPDTLAVLYAPTWRDSVSTARGYSLVRYLEPAAVRQRFGGHATVLLRGHANTLGDRAEPESGVIDVSTHPAINDLFIAADVLVTDYSSVMFDFCVTGKPMLFLTPDIADYRDKTRGFYFDFAGQAPGPLCMTSTEVVDALADLAGVQQRFAERYAAFRDRYAPNDDGGAAARVVDAFWR